MNWAAKIRAHSASKQPRPRKVRPVVQTAWLQTRAPNEETGDPGSVVDIYYTVQDNAVTLTNDKGTPIGKAGSYVLQPGETAAQIAKRLGMVGVDRSYDAPMNVSWVV